MNNSTIKNGRTKPTIDISNIVYGKVPPQAKDLEESVLGEILFIPNAFEIAADILKPESFYVDAHQRIFKAFVSLARKSSPIDRLTVIEELKATEELDIVGGPYKIFQLTNDVVGAGNIEAHSRIIQQKFFARELIRISGEIMAEAFEDSTDVFQLMDSAENKISALLITKQNKPYKSLLEVSEQTLQRIEERRSQPDIISGVPCGIRKIDFITQGWQPGEFIIIAARPSVGKSAVAANVGLNAAMDEIKPTAVGMFLLEMKDVQYAMNMLSAQSYIDKWLLKTGKVTDEQMRLLERIVYNKFKDLKVFIDDSSSLTIYQLKAKARRMVLKDKVGLIVVDYMQLMSGEREKNDNREQEISKISREFKQLAKELNVPVIALSQLSRSGDTNEPMLRHLRESGAIEQDADMVWFLIAPTDDMIAEDATLKDSLLIKIAKFRDGALDKIPVKFVKEIQKIMSEAEYENYQLRQNHLLPMSVAEDRVKNFYEKDEKDFSTGINNEGF